MFRGSFRGGGGGGGGGLSVISIASSDSPYSLGVGETALLVDSSGGMVNVDLPSAASSRGILYYIKNTAGANINRVRVLVSSGLIDDSTFIDLDQEFSAVTLVSDGTNYWIVS